jgi:cell division protein FtsL
MAVVGSAEIYLIIVILLLLLPTGIIIYVLYAILKRQGRIKELESRVAALEKDKDKEARLNTLEKRIDEMKR